jgi:hypothetical protein
LLLSNEKPFLKKYFDSLGFFNEDLIKTDYIFEPFFKMSNKIFLNEKDYIIIEYFEKNNLDKYAGIFSEKLRIGNILTFSKEEKCKKFYVGETAMRPDWEFYRHLGLSEGLVPFTFNTPVFLVLFSLLQI